MLKRLLESFKIHHVAPDDQSTTTYSLTAGTSDVNSVAVNALGCNSVVFLWQLGDNADTATFTGKIQCSANGTTGWEDVEGATDSFVSGASDTDHKMFAIECGVVPGKPYYRAVTDRGTANVALSAMYAFTGLADRQPVTQGTGTGQFVKAPVVI